MKIYTLIGGVNGAGKSSLTGSLRSERNDFGIVVDSDKLTIQCGGDEYEGGKLAVERIERALMDGVNFTQETTLSGDIPSGFANVQKKLDIIFVCTMPVLIPPKKVFDEFETV